MGEIRTVEPVIRICAVISRDRAAHRWARDRLSEAWGNVAIETPAFPFVASRFYEPTMGTDLIKVLLAFAPVAEPAELADWKHQTNAWEREFATQFLTDLPRPLNLDPGYVTQAKLVLATTKDRDHRIYLRDGMFAEVTLSLTGGHWVSHRWTYPDYQSEDVIEFVAACREQLRDHLKRTGIRRSP